jgi:hypothetical protein
MKSHVDLQTTSSRVSFVAAVNFAHKRFLAGMSQLMGLQVALGNKLLIAFDADEWSLSGMGPHMRLQVTCFSKLFQALFERTYQYLFLVFGSLDFLELLYLTNNESINNCTYKVEKKHLTMQSWVLKICGYHCNPCWMVTGAHYSKNDKNEIEELTLLMNALLGLPMLSSIVAMRSSGEIS